LIPCGICGATVPKEHEHDKHILCKACFDAIGDDEAYDDNIGDESETASSLVSGMSESRPESSDEIRAKTANKSWILTKEETEK
jgi:hypothetical protein